MNVLKLLNAASKEREKYFNPSGNPVPVGFRFTEFAGEAGEVANAGKKLMRHDLGIVGGSPDMTNLKEELGDAIISLALIASHYNVDLWSCVVDKFNKTSDKHNFPVKLEKDFFWKQCSAGKHQIIAGEDSKPNEDDCCEGCGREL